MAKDMKIIKELLSSKDIIYPHQLYDGLNLSEQDFMSIRDILEKSHEETIKKYLTIRNIGNSIIEKDGILQGIYYREIDFPELILIFKDKNPLNWEKRKKAADDKAKKIFKDLRDKEAVKEMTPNEEEEFDDANAELNPSSLVEKATKKISKKNEKLTAAERKIEELEAEQRAYQEKNKDILAEIDSFDITNTIKIQNGEAVFNTDEYDYKLPALTINEQILDYLLNSTNLGSHLDIALVGTYVDELKQFKTALESGILYPDFHTSDFTGTLGIQSKHRGLTILKQNNSMTIPSDFGKITVYLNVSTVWHALKLVYTADDNDYSISSDINYCNRVVDRGFVHKALLPEPYRKNN